MQIDQKTIIESIKSANDVGEILNHVRRLEQEINAGYTLQDLEEISAVARTRCDELQAESDAQLARATRSLHLLQQAATLDPSLVTVEFLKELDGQAVWLSDEYLSARRNCGGDRPKLTAFLDRVAEVKAQAQAEGFVFSA